MPRFESFVLRLTVDDDQKQVDGQVTHVASQETSFFKNLANLESLIIKSLFHRNHGSRSTQEEYPTETEIDAEESDPNSDIPLKNQGSGM